ncbi:basic amino acid ABC transporter substrate-binding protein [Desulforhabdus amnigena]|jgi:polar amino acid transport system substrate-binding protein|uniref:Basic amino acid ABC transporter substrate-binding protein n=1 Tax=Desulforhabdus amnigena TaxID=40218 RepID=A0A9W6FU33_9BACT|nr:basic amino acid ABC transporter substrate-binding protein [Desulforhabdus amnigena]NLJ28757.1 basic amino acid ABC transporter substrate-binding protein [Deltaproteobacteria bacterium]GLI34895.1 basic amino acid ABC transporter substrate-binding protein [Desulforhabdus amnigena]
MMKRVLLTLIAAVMLTSSVWAKTIVVAQDATWPPMEFMNDQKEIIGFDTDYVRAVAKEAGFDVVFKNVAWDGIFAGLDAGQYDAVCSSVTITEERKNAMDFGIPYFKVRQALVVPKESTAKTLEEMKGKTVGAQIGTTGYFAIKKIEGVTAKSYDEIGLAMEDLFSNRIDGVVCDDPVAAQYALQKAEYAAKLKIAAVLDTGDEYYGIAVKKGNKEVLDLINKGIAAVQAKGIDKELRAKWMGQ